MEVEHLLWTFHIFNKNTDLKQRVKKAEASIA